MDCSPLAPARLAPVPYIPALLSPARPALWQTVSRTGSQRCTHTLGASTVAPEASTTAANALAFCLLKPLGMVVGLTEQTSREHLPHRCTFDGGWCSDGAVENRHVFTSDRHRRPRPTPRHRCSKGAPPLPPSWANVPLYCACVWFEKRCLV